MPHNNNEPSENEMWETFLEFMDSYSPPATEIEGTRKMIHALTAEADAQAESRRSAEIDKLHKMLGETKDPR